MPTWTSSISELELLGKPCILVPSPNVAEDHQTKNARALSDVGAAILVTDADARGSLVDTAVRTMSDRKALDSMSAAVSRLALRDSDQRIVDEVIKILNK